LKTLQELLYEIRRLEKEAHKRKEGEIWVSDLARCPLKVEYEVRYPELAVQDIYHPSFILGDLVHKGVETLAKEFLEKDEVKVEVEVEGRREMEIGGVKYVIVGRADIILTSGGHRVGYELKYCRSDPGLPLEHHVLQARLYKWLFNLDTVKLLYITPDRITEYEIKDEVSDDDVMRLVVEHLSKARTPKWPWECKYCTYSVLCPFKRG